MKPRCSGNLTAHTPSSFARTHRAAHQRVWIALACAFAFLATSAAFATFDAEDAEAQTRRKRKRKKRSKSPRREGFYLRFALGTPGGCMSPTDICPETSSASFDPLSIDGSFGYRFQYLTLEARGFYNPFEISNQLAPGQGEEQLMDPYFWSFLVGTKIMPLSGRERIDPYLSLGVGFLQAAGQQLGQRYDTLGGMFSVGGGVDYYLSRAVAIGASYDAFFLQPEDETQDDTTFWAGRVNFTFYLGKGSSSSSSSRKKKRRRRNNAAPTTPKKKKKTY